MPTLKQYIEGEMKHLQFCEENTKGTLSNVKYYTGSVVSAALTSLAQHILTSEIERVEGMKKTPRNYTTEIDVYNQALDTYKSHLQEQLSALNNQP